MKNINKIMLSIFAILLLSISFVVAEGTIDSPKAHAGVTGNYTLNVTITNSASGYDNVSFYYSQQTGTPTTWTLLDSVANNSAEQAEFTYGIATTTLTDGIITFNVTLSNDSVGAVVQFSNLSVANDVDNNEANSSYGIGTPANNGVVDYNNVTLNIGTDTALTNCTLSITPTPTGNNTMEFTASSGFCGFHLKNVADGAYTYNLTSEDGINLTILSTRVFEINTGTGAGGAVLLQQQAQSQTTQTQQQSTSTIIIAIIVLIIVIYFFKKKR